MQPPICWVLGAVSSGLKQPWLEADLTVSVTVPPQPRICVWYGA
jgi:hypothetical protein